MPASTAANAALRKSVRGSWSLLRSWWQRRVSFAISLSITLGAFALYTYTYIGERPTPFFDFVQRLESNALDTRFRYRPARLTPPDPRIVIVDIDQHSQEVLGRWPFSRTHFARLLDVLREDGAQVAAFDITFDKPDQSAAPIRELRKNLEERRSQGESVDAKL